MPSAVAEHTATPADWQLLVLAGGKGSRMEGADKGLMLIEGKPAVSRLQQRFSPPSMLTSANRHADRYAALGVQTVADVRPGFCGPLAGLEALLRQSFSHRAVLVPCDMPWLPASLPQQLLGELAGDDSIVIAHDGERLQPLCMALCPTRWRENLSGYLDQGGRSVHGWLEGKPVQVCQFASPQAFRNLNTVEDLAGC
ncbi:MAG: molybdenum cofactor guanylyltransferase [Alcanivoracaceae bacterium]|jgi:molybdenum cofactor guanylyltransferase|nr:molybdenum cofactor guanylyltransferase [Alcanivoracaceae bacterium]